MYRYMCIAIAIAIAIISAMATGRLRQQGKKLSKKRKRNVTNSLQLFSRKETELSGLHPTVAGTHTQ